MAAVALVSGSRAAAEDAVQESLARAWERSDRGERIESLTAWVVTVALNLARSGLRRIRAERRARERMAAPRGPAPPDSALDLERALRSLPRREREATVLHYYLDLSVGETAAVMGVVDGTVKTLLHRSRRTLADVLEEPEEVTDVAER